MAEATLATKKPAKAEAPIQKVAPEPKKQESWPFAVIATGGKQYRVKVGDLVKIEKLSDTHKEGDKITFDHVLMVDNGAALAMFGTPFIAGKSVSATLHKIGRYKTIDVIKYKQKSRYFKKYGHRQPYFEVKIDSIK